MARRASAAQAVSFASALEKLIVPIHPAPFSGNLDALIAQVQRIVDESGSTLDFDARSWTLSWLARPVPALGWRRPCELLNSAEGWQLIGRLIAQMQSGAYA